MSALCLQFVCYRKTLVLFVVVDSEDSDWLAWLYPSPYEFRFSARARDNISHHYPRAGPLINDLFIYFYHWFIGLI